MKAMKSGATLALILALSGPAHAQSTPPPSATAPSAATLEILLAEVRLLRQAIERQTVVVARSQVLAARLSVQEQRLARARTLHESLESQMTRAKAEEAQATSALERMEAALDDPARAAQRKDIEGEIRVVRDRLKSMEAAIGEFQTRLTLALQGAEQERLRLDDLESQLLREDFSGREKR
jgi:predicted  nucleic acid-binding Zn-ribbon protein